MLPRVLAALFSDAMEQPVAKKSKTCAAGSQQAAACTDTRVATKLAKQAKKRTSGKLAGSANASTVSPAESTHRLRERVRGLLEGTPKRGRAAVFTASGIEPRMPYHFRPREHLEALSDFFGTHMPGHATGPVCDDDINRIEAACALLELMTGSKRCTGRVSSVVGIDDTTACTKHNAAGVVGVTSISCKRTAHS